MIIIFYLANLILILKTCKYRQAKLNNWFLKCIFKKILEEYESCKQAEKKNNISPGNVSKAAKRGSKSGGFYWQYKFLSDKDTDRYGH